MLRDGLAARDSQIPVMGWTRPGKHRCWGQGRVPGFANCQSRSGETYCQVRSAGPGGEWTMP